MRPRELSYRQRLYVPLYLGRAGGNATRSAKLAGHPHPNKAGPRLAGDRGVRASIDARLASAAMEAVEVLARPSTLATPGVEDFLRFDPAGAPDAPPRLSLRRVQRWGRLGIVGNPRSINYINFYMILTTIFFSPS